MVQYKDQELLDALAKCKEKYGKITTQLLNNDDDFPSGATYSYRFESLADAAREAGLDDETKTLEQNIKQRTGYTKEEIIESVEEGAEDRKISPTVINDETDVSASVVREIIGGSIVGKKIGDIDIVSHKEFKYNTREEILSIANNIVESYGYLKKTELHRRVTPANIRKNFNSVKELADEVGAETYAEFRSQDDEELFKTKYVYVLSVEDGFYVGKSVDPINRIHSHETSVEEVERIRRVPEEKDPLDYEREVALSVAIEYETTDIGGGK